MPISARIMSNGSKIVPFRITARSPVAMLNTIQMTAAPNTSEKVTGAADAIAGTTKSA